MEHEVFVPVPAERLREVLGDPARVARAVPGLQQDAGAEPGAGRLKVRIGSHSITYRGSVRVAAQDDGAYAAEGDATEARGTGSVRLALRMRVRDAEGGSTLAFDGTAAADGRVTELPADAVRSAVVRLLNRFAENLGAAAQEKPESEPDQEAGAPGTTDDLATQDFEARATADFETTPDADDAPAPTPVDEPPPSAPAEPAADAEPAVTKGDGDDGDEEDEGDTGEVAARTGEIGEAVSADPVAEAAHARRTMIGRSAEEVDHAPPRGRYAPVPAPQTVTPPAPLRWVAPAAALAVASAIVAVRALRRRR